jgi:tetratricopeptide (TPR) repeat protein
MHLYPKERIDAHDELHWTKPSQNWNFMCADCHSTDLKKNYDAKTDKFATTFEAINVGCEACHGPGSAHIDWAKDGGKGKDSGLTALFEKHKDIHWQHNKETGKPQRSEPRTNDNEIEVCAQCHSRRAQISEGYHAGKPFLDHYLPSLPLPPLYHIDGQQRDEVYNWGSFLQSRMYQAGVTCSDCHEPHTQQLRAEGNAVCAQCHLPSNYDTPKHTHHEMNSAGSQCVNCHMPNTTYMVIDSRRDHSLRVPRPDLSVTTGAPNACTSCHNDKNAKWAADKVHAWLGRDAQGLQNYASAFHAAAQGNANASDQLAAVVQYVSSPTIAKAAAIELLGSIPSEQTLKTIEENINSSDALIRLASVQALPSLPPEDQIRLGTPQLSSSLKAIRIETARVLLPSSQQIPDQYRDAFEKAVTEYEASLHYNEDRPESRMALGMLQAYRGNLTDAQTTLEKTIKSFPAFVPAYANLADIQRASGNEVTVQQTLRAGINAVPQDATLRYALGLSLIRAQQKAEAIESLKKATQLAPDNSQFAYVYAVGLAETENKKAAITEINRALKLHPNDNNLLHARDSFK